MAGGRKLTAVMSAGLSVTKGGMELTTIPLPKLISSTASLESEVIPEFYDRDKTGLPRAWLKKVRKSISLLTPRFSANRGASIPGPGLRSSSEGLQRNNS